MLRAAKARAVRESPEGGTIAHRQRKRNAAADSISKQEVQYWLHRHVYLCVVPTAAVLMDLRNDQYFAISAADSASLARVVQGWPDSPSATPCSEYIDATHVAALAEQLTAKQLLTKHRHEGKSATPHSLSLLDVTVGAGQDLEQRRAVRFADVVRFLAASIYALCVLRFGQLDRIVARAQYRGEQRADRNDSTRTTTLLELVTTFRRIRVFMFGARDNCLLHALTLRTFLSFYGISPTWVFGIKMNPWAAHTWVQHDNLVLDGSPEEIRHYAPILVIRG